MGKKEGNRKGLKRADKKEGCGGRIKLKKEEQVGEVSEQDRKGLRMKGIEKG
jgi:hypothetical protein